MRVGAVLSPVADWSAVADAARVADQLGFDSIGLWSHYHSARPDWAYVSGWAAYGALASMTNRVRLVPMVLNNLHYQLGVLAKESSMLAIFSGGRFELAIGGGDWPESFTAWGERFPEADERVARLAESIPALRRIWAGQPVTMDGDFVRLSDAYSTPSPDEAPRVVVGVGSSLRTARAVLEHADEINVYADARLIDDVRAVAARSDREIEISLFLSWEWDKWPADPVAELDVWRRQGVDRVFVSLGSADMPRRLEALTPLFDAMPAAAGSSDAD